MGLRFIAVLSTLGLFFAQSNVQAQVVQEQGSLMGWVHQHITQDMPIENSNGYVKPSAIDLNRFEAIFDLFLVGAYEQVSDSLTAYFPSYEIVHLIDSTFEHNEYYMIRENPVSKGWGTYVLNPTFQRDALVAAPHPLHDSNTPYESVDLLHFLNARMFVLAGTHRCASSEFSLCDGTTKVCSATNSSEAFRISDMAHNDSTVFQRAHESMFNLSPNAWFLNIHGHADSNCEDVFLSNGRADDSKEVLQNLRDSLQSRGVDVAMAGDGSTCTLTGGTNTQGRLLNGSNDPCGTANVSNSGRFFHIEQFTSIRQAQDKYRILIEELADMIPRTSHSKVIPDFNSLSINEIHFFPISPHGDASGNGTVQTITDEFVEIVNTDSKTVDLSGWSLADNTQVRHVFPSGTRLVAGQAIVVFGGAFSGDFGGSFVQTASTAQLNLNNNKETVLILAPTGAPVFSANYDTANTNFSGGSLVRNPELIGDFQYHKLVDGVDESWFSPGKTTTNAIFVPYATITDIEGWRMLSAPTQDYPLENISAFTAIQGIDDGFDANIYTGYNGSNWTKPANLQELMQAGTGFIVYFFNNEQAGSQTLPLTLRASGTVKTEDVHIGLHQNGNKFNLIGNPFSQAIDFSEIIENNGSLESTVAHIWDPNLSVYTTSTAWGDSIGAWQGFMIENNNATSITFPISSIIDGGKFANGSLLKSQEVSSKLVYKLSFILLKNDVAHEYDHVFLVIEKNDPTRLNKLDAKKLWPLRASKKQFAWSDNNQQLMQKALSINAYQDELLLSEWGQEEGEIQISLTQVQGESSPITLQFVDIEQMTEIQLSLNESKTVAAKKIGAVLKSSSHETVQNVDYMPRWRVRISTLTTSLEENSSSEKDSFELFQNYPNPFNPTTKLTYRLHEFGPVTLEIFTVLGAKVATLVQQEQTKGLYEVQFNASGLSSGIYFYTLRTPHLNQTKKMILIK